MLSEDIKKIDKINKNSKCITRQLTDDEKIKYGIVEKGGEKILELKIDEELRDLLPPLSKDEFEILEENIKINGCIDPIVTWNGTIIDGHNRYNICTKHNIIFKTTDIAFMCKDDVIQWMVETQLGRRNLSPLQRVQIAEKYRPVFKRKAEENLKTSTGGNNPQPLQISANPVHTRNELSKIAKVSHDTYGKAKKIIDLEEEEKKGKVILTDSQKETISQVKKDEVKLIQLSMIYLVNQKQQINRYRK